MADYRYLLVDILTGQRLAELPFESARYTDTLNAPGSFTGTMPLKPKEPLLSVLQASLQLGRVSVWVERDGTIMWCGPLWTDSSYFTTDAYVLNGEGWLSYFRRRLLRADKTYTGVEQVLIAKDLLDYAQVQPGGNVGVVTTDTTATGVTRDRTYLAVERGWIGERIEQLAAVLNGFFFRFEGRWSGGTLQTRFLTSYPKTGRVTDLVFELGKQLTGDNCRRDATALVSHVDAIGATPSAGTEPLLGSASDTSRLANMPMLDDVVTFSDVSVQATLDAHAANRLARGKTPMDIPALQVDAGGDTPLGSYVVGDNVEVRIDAGLCQLNDRYIVTERSVDVDASGGETVTCSYAQVDAFAA